MYCETIFGTTANVSEKFALFYSFSHSLSTTRERFCVMFYLPGFKYLTAKENIFIRSR